MLAISARNLRNLLEWDLSKLMKYFLIYAILLSTNEKFKSIHTLPENFKEDFVGLFHVE
jgi:hypothetical protein